MHTPIPYTTGEVGSIFDIGPELLELFGTELRLNNPSHSQTHVTYLTFLFRLIALYVREIVNSYDDRSLAFFGKKLSQLNSQLDNTSSINAATSTNIRAGLIGTIDKLIGYLTKKYSQLPQSTIKIPNYTGPDRRNSELRILLLLKVDPTNIEFWDKLIALIDRQSPSTGIRRTDRNMCISPFALTGNTVVTQPTASDAAKPADGLAATVSDAHALNRITPPIDIFPVTTPVDHLGSHGENQAILSKKIGIQGISQLRASVATSINDTILRKYIATGNFGVAGRITEKRMDLLSKGIGGISTFTEAIAFGKEIMRHTKPIANPNNLVEGRLIDFLNDRTTQIRNKLLLDLSVYFQTAITESIGRIPRLSSKIDGTIVADLIDQLSRGEKMLRHLEAQIRERRISANGIGILLDDISEIIQGVQVVIDFQPFGGADTNSTHTAGAVNEDHYGTQKDHVEGANTQGGIETDQPATLANWGSSSLFGNTAIFPSSDHLPSQTPDVPVETRVTHLSGDDLSVPSSPGNFQVARNTGDVSDKLYSPRLSNHLLNLNTDKPILVKYTSDNKQGELEITKLQKIGNTDQHEIHVTFKKDDGSTSTGVLIINVRSCIVGNNDNTISGRNGKKISFVITSIESANRARTTGYTVSGPVAQPAGSTQSNTTQVMSQAEGINSQPNQIGDSSNPLIFPGGRPVFPGSFHTISDPISTTYTTTDKRLVLPFYITAVSNPIGEIYIVKTKVDMRQAIYTSYAIQSDSGGRFILQGLCESAGEHTADHHALIGTLSEQDTALSKLETACIRVSPAPPASKPTVTPATPANSSWFKNPIQSAQGAIQKMAKWWRGS